MGKKGGERPFCSKKKNYRICTQEKERNSPISRGFQEVSFFGWTKKHPDREEKKRKKGLPHQK